VVLPAGLFIILISEPIFYFKFFTSPVYSPQIFFSNYFFKIFFFNLCETGAGKELFAITLHRNGHNDGLLCHQGAAEFIVKHTLQQI
jgi:hypothetical protein